MIDFEFSYDQFDSPLLSRDPFSISKLGIEIGHLIDTHVRRGYNENGYFVNKNKLFQCTHILLSSLPTVFLLCSILLLSYRAFLFLNLNQTTINPDTRLFFLLIIDTLDKIKIKF